MARNTARREVLRTDDTLAPTDIPLDPTSNVLREISNYNYGILDVGRILDVSKETTGTIPGDENNVLRQLPNYNGSRITKKQQKTKERGGLKRRMMEAIERADEIPDKLETVRVEEQRFGNIIQRTTHLNNYAHPYRIVEKSTFEITGTNMRLIRQERSRPVELGVAELCEEKLDEMRDKHHKTFEDSVFSLVKEYEKKCKELGDTPTPRQETDLQNEYKGKLDKARETFDKAMADFDKKYKDAPLGNQLLTALQQIQAKENNEADIGNRTKSVESKIAKHPEKLNENTQAIEAQLTAIEGFIATIGGAMDSSVAGAEQDTRSGAQIVTSLRSSLSRGSVSLTDYTRDLVELTKRCPLGDAGNDLYKTIGKTMDLFTDRRIIIDEREVLLFKRERYVRSQDAETMGYNNRLVQLYKRMEGIRQELAKAEELHGNFVREADRIYKEVRTNKDKDSRPATGATNFSSDQPGGERYRRMRESIDDLRRLQEERGADNILPPEIAEEFTRFIARRSRIQPIGETSVEGARAETEEEAEHIDAAKSERYKQVQNLLDRTFFNLLSVRAEATKLDQMERSLQKEIELAGGRYDTNEVREGRFRDRIVELDQEELEKKRNNYEQIFTHQKQVAAMRVQVLMAQFAAREATKFAVLSMMLNQSSLPNAVQREFSGSNSSAQTFMRNL